MARLDEARKKQNAMASADNLNQATLNTTSARTSSMTLTGLSVEEAEELHRNLVQGTIFFGMIAILAHLLAYIYSPWLK
jgi:cation transporter-like permease